MFSIFTNGALLSTITERRRYELIAIYVDYKIQLCQALFDRWAKFIFGDRHINTCTQRRILHRVYAKSFRKRCMFNKIGYGYKRTRLRLTKTSVTFLSLCHYPKVYFDMIERMNNKIDCSFPFLSFHSVHIHFHVKNKKERIKGKPR